MDSFLLSKLLLPIVLFSIISIGQELSSTSEQHILDELCKNGGTFINPFDPTGQTYVRCNLASIQFKCDQNFVYDEQKKMCVLDSEHNFDTNKIDWTKVLKCSDYDDTFHRNPYNCSLFYRCYQQGEFNRIDVHTCVQDMIFDEFLWTCISIIEYRALYQSDCIPKRLPDWIFDHRYRKDESTEDYQAETTTFDTQDDDWLPIPNDWLIQDLNI
ncbi:hypothetical protein RDWZM_001571 [Blomia tropicalis]|uniref:Chitin-binding type-2 domain-containing protein n=1 Tax=Blomia tropicalis TaxID=40697 RepID=A0A9Q0RQR7_BLOTA|nr:hypothetical protein BLOT_007718 [Blomia tropicalis]KAJ6223026.1 hypothetical protein RDWZM_001571 [Blomia tropicalis]